MDEADAPLAHIELDEETFQQVADYTAAMMRRWARVGLHVDVSSASVRIGAGALLEALGLTHPADHSREPAQPPETILVRVDGAERYYQDEAEEPDFDVESMSLEEKREVAKEFIGVAVTESGTFTATYAGTRLGTYADPVVAARMRDEAARTAGQPEHRMNFPPHGAVA